ncbi:hypothetical protein SLEP1_g48905 [Rubroshorea leprosula]|uniref:Uncharacterized protein n=1 Tax=Rubroshorea leprosula TaxID=152421 RepID=A0AAV5LV56_9ROSI|nr:hypothetical protein SLEP1_g48905 [Rubroshorea leprosula]
MFLAMVKRADGKRVGDVCFLIVPVKYAGNPEDARCG